MQKLILASSSPRRLDLLKSINYYPDEVISPDIDESPMPREKPEKMASRLALEKAKAINREGFILACDTIVATKAKFFDKATSREQVEEYINFYSGRRIYIHSAIAALKIENGIITKTGQKLVTSIVKFKRFSIDEIKYYLDSGNGVGAAGGFAVQGLGETLIQWMSGSFSGMVGLPLCETVSLLKGIGFNNESKSTR